MRYVITLALSLGVAASAASQTQGEIIIRRPGVPDRVIRLDSNAAKEEVTKIQMQLHEFASSRNLQERELAAKLSELHTRLRTNLEPLRMKTLARTEGDLAATRMPSMRNFDILALRRPLLGITVRPEPSETDKYGAFIQAVTPGSPAEKAGIMSGDIIARIAGKSLIEKNGKEDSSPGIRLIEVISTLAVGRPVDVELRRGTRTVNVKVTPIEGAMSGTLALSAPSFAEIPRLGVARMSEAPMFGRITTAPQQWNVFTSGNGTFAYGFGNNGLFANVELTSLNEKLGSYFGATEGVLVVNVGMPRDDVVMGIAPMAAARGGAGGAMVTRRMDTAVVYVDGVPVPPGIRREAVKIPLEPGDVILSVDGRKVTSPSQLMRIVGSYEHNDEFKLQIVRQKHSETLTVKMP